MTTTVAFLNEKGGVGKTTVTLGIVSAAQAAGQKVLVIDMDPQASATWTLGIEPSDDTLSVSDVLQSGDPGLAKEAIVTSTWGPDIHVMPASRILFERERDDRRKGDRRLRKVLAEVTAPYDFVVIDCPPSLGQNTRNALAASDFAVLVVELAGYSLRGVAAVLDLIDDVWQESNDTLDLAGVITNRVPPQSSEADRRMGELVDLVGRKAIWKPPVPQRSIINQANGDQVPIHSFGYKAKDVTEVFDGYFAKLRRLKKG
jgi:chromosome partitioning protein